MGALNCKEDDGGLQGSITLLDLLLAGFDQVNESDVGQWFDATMTLDLTSSSADPQLLQALQILNAIDPVTAVEWLQALKQAQQQGNFDQVYDQLLSQGMGQLQQAYMLLLSTTNPADVKVYLGQIVSYFQPDQERSLQMIIIWWRIIDFLTHKHFPNWSPGDATAFADNFIRQLQLAIVVLQPMMGVFCGQIGPCAPFGNPQEQNWFETMVEAIIVHIWQHSSPQDQLI